MQIDREDTWCSGHVNGVAYPLNACIRGKNSDSKTGSIDGFGSSTAILVKNTFTGIGDRYTRNWTPTATMLNVNNVKN